MDDLNQLNKISNGLPTKTVIIGLGNPYLKDDGVGNRVAVILKERLADDPSVTVLELSVGGLRLMEALTGYDRSIIIDAMRSGRYRPGTVRKLDPEKLGMALHATSSHDTSLARALESGRYLGIALPQELEFWGIEARETETFGETMSREVEDAVPKAVEVVLQEFYKARS